MSNHAVHHSRGPVIKRETMQLFERATIAGQLQFVPFEREILWVRESSAKVYLRHRGVEISPLATFNDFYGYLTSVQHAVLEAPRYHEQFKIQQDDALTIEIELSVCDRPLLEDTSPAGVEHNRQWARRQYLASDHGWYTSDQPRDDGRYPRLETRVFVNHELVWTTPLGYFGQARVEALSDEVSHLFPQQ